MVIYQNKTVSQMSDIVKTGQLAIFVELDTDRAPCIQTRSLKNHILKISSLVLILNIMDEILIYVASKEV